jgi:hypothetical protein
MDEAKQVMQRIQTPSALLLIPGFVASAASAHPGGQDAIDCPSTRGQVPE